MITSTRKQHLPALALAAAAMILVACAALPVVEARFSAQADDADGSFVADVWVEVKALDGGEGHACLVRKLGTVWCWGLNDKGQLGDGTTTDRWVPVQVAGSGGAGTLTGVTSGASGSKHNCAVTSAGSVWCWGRNDKGQLGDDTTSDRTAPVQVKGVGGSGTLSGVVAVAAGATHACAVTSGGSVFCWGRNDKGQLGDDTTSDRTAPVQVKGVGGSGTLSGAVAVAAGATHSCAVTSGGSVFCWGRNDKGQLGDDTTSDRTAPVQVKGVGGSGTLSGVVAVAAGATHSCAVTSGGSVFCWGRNDKGQLGDDTTSDRTAPVQVKGVGGSGTLSGAVAVAAGATHSCAVTSGGSVFCWGRNDKGQLGDDTTSDRTAPVQVKGVGGSGTLSGAVAVAAGATHACAVTSGGSVFCWGRNDKGQLGDDTTSDRTAPVQVAGEGGSGVLAMVAVVAAGDQHTCAVNDDRTTRCWGLNSEAQLGDGTTDDSSHPSRVV